MQLETIARNALADAFDDLVNTGSGTARFRLETSGGTAVATISLQNPAFGAASNGVITLQGTPLQDTNAAGGTVARGAIYNRNDARVSISNAATSGAEITVSSTTIGAGETVTLSSLTVTVPAGNP
jgi:hypothetical protein